MSRDSSMAQPRKHFVNVGDVYGRLTVIGEAAQEDNSNYARCKCSCGKVRDFLIRNITTGKSRSCGCAWREAASNRLKKHGLSWGENGKMNRLYKIWLDMKERCYNSKNSSFKRYGGRGVTVCDEWRNDYSAFHEWALRNGYKPGLTIERVNNDGDYCPENCVWADRRAQARNRSTNHILKYRGKNYTLAEASELSGLDHSTLIGRLSRGWSVKDAIEKPLDNRGGHNCLSSKP